MSLVGMPGYQETPAGWIPHDWMATTLGAVADFKGGNAFKEKFQGKKAGDFPFIKVSDFSLPLNQKFIRDANNWIDADTNKEIKATLFEQGAVVFAKVGAALLLNRRRVLTRKTAIDNNLMAATPRTIDPTFLYFHLQTVDFGKLVQDGAVPSVNQGQLQALPLAQPPLAEQQKIAAILTAVDDKLDVIARQIEATQTLKQGLMQTLFSRGVGTQDADGRWVPHAEFKDSELGEIPAAWTVRTLGSVTEEVRERNSGKLDDALLCGVLKDQGLVPMRERVKGATTERCRVVSPSAFAYNPMRINIGSIARNLRDHAVMVSPDYVVFATRPGELLPGFLDHFRRSDEWQRFVGRSGDGGVRIRIYYDDLAQLPLKVPPLAEQVKVVEVLDCLTTKLNQLVVKRNEMQTLKRGLMQKLLTGEWRVNVDASTTGT